MYKTCSICRKIHDINIVCKKIYKKKPSLYNKFRNTYEWQQKRESVKKRDKYLCQVCINGYDDTLYRFNYKDLQVHHIIPLEEDYSKRLDSDNLISLCPMHHKRAEEGLISKDELQKMITKE